MSTRLSKRLSVSKRKGAQVKKKKLSIEDIEDSFEEDDDDTDKDDDYRPVKNEESSESDFEETSKFFKEPKKKGKRVDVLQKASDSGAVKTEFKVKSYKDLSDTSSDEEIEAVSEQKLCVDADRKSWRKSEDDQTDDKDSDTNSGEENTYFDFTQIIQRQEVIKSALDVKNKSENPKGRKSASKGGKDATDLDVMELLQKVEGVDQVEDEETVEGCEEKVESSEGVQVRIELPGCRRKKSKKPDLEASLKRRFNSIKKENQVYAHKVHLLCWIAHGNRMNSVVSDQDLMGIALSLIPSSYCYPPKRCDLNYLEKLVEWYTGKIRLYKNYKGKGSGNVAETLEEQFLGRKANSNKDLALMFVCLCRALGLTCRLIISLRPVPLKPPVNELFKVSLKTTDAAINGEKSEKDKPKKGPRKNTSKYFKEAVKKSSPNESAAGTSAVDALVKSRRSRCRSEGGKKNKKGEESDDDLIPKKPGRKSQSDLPDRRVLSSDEDEALMKKMKGCIDEWAEVYLEAEEKWICCDLSRGQIHCMKQLYSSATQPVTYVLGWENDGSIKDVTRRYVPHWMTVTRKLRVDADWWDEALKPFAPPRNARHREEDDILDKQMEEQGVPTSVSEFKNHPLYVLPRHLLKFQAIYPRDAPTLGFCRGEPIYSRSCVAELHTRESWIKEAKVVGIGQEPYKIVKARPKYDKVTGQKMSDLPLPLFGFWQVEDYMPPPAVDGKVPRNEYGNVEMYKPCMLPPGTVHLQLPGLFRVAKKLGIDCAPAVVGWHFHGGGSAPILDGFIVCEEFREALVDAWNQEVDMAAKRAQDKLEQRVYGNWRRLIKGLLIREKLKLKYGFDEEQEEEKRKKESKRQPKATRKKASGKQKPNTDV